MSASTSVVSVDGTKMISITNMNRTRACRVPEFFILPELLASRNR